MTTDTPADGVTVDLHVRSLAPRAGHTQQDRVIERLDDLASAGRLEEFSVNVWGHKVSLSTASARTDTGQFVLDRVDQFRDWAEETGRSVESFFETQRVESELLDEQYVALVLPMLTMAEYHDGDLAYVAPCSDGSSVCTVEDRLDVLEASRVTDAIGREDSRASGVLVAEEEE